MKPDSIYIIKGKIYSNVVSCKEGSYYNSPILRVTFTSKGEYVTRSYNIYDVTKLQHEKTYTGDFRYCDENKKYGIIHTIHEYKNRGNIVYGLEYLNGYTTYVYKDCCQIESSIRDQKGKVLTYLESLSGLSRIGIGEEGEISLADKYAAAKFVFKGSLMAKYLEPKKAKLEYHRKPCFMVFPFGCNEDQFAAVEKALTSDISIIQGPPGTGKTQTILNIVANLLLQEKNIQIVSNNNSAVLNINEKLASLGYDFLVAFLGKAENKDRFFENQTGLYPLMQKWEQSSKKITEIKTLLSQISVQLPNYFRNIQRVACLKELISQYESQTNQYSYLESRKLPKCSSAKLYALLLSIEDNLSRKSRISLANRIKSWIHGFGFKAIDREALETAANRIKHIENKKELARLVKECNKIEGLYKNYTALSREYFEAYLFEKFGKRQSRPIFQAKDLLSFDVQNFLKEYPIILSTTFSATTNINQAVPFDMIIMDEASQVDISAGALSLNSANSAVIVGDDKQLPNVVTEDVRIKADSLYSQYGMTPEYKYSGNSFLSSVQQVFPEAPVTLLREHYRCEPRIIGFCNERFYRGQLIPMTKRSEQSSLSVIKTVKGNHAIGTTNMRQAEEAVLEVEKLKEQYDSIGVIVPYNEQAKLISQLLGKKGLEEIPVSTVHKFQGREEDAIVLCTVDNTIREFVDDPHLLNVAVSRAKKHFSIIVNGNDMADSNIRALVNYIENSEGIIKEGTIRSVFDILYKQYTEERMEFVSKHANISEYISENIMMAVLKEIVAMPTWQHLNILFQYPLARLINSNNTDLTEEEYTYANHSWTLLDFLLYDATTKQAILVIEVDGVSFHQKGSIRWNRDQLKNSILEKVGVPLLRLNTKGSNEKELIIKRLEELREKSAPIH